MKILLGTFLAAIFAVLTVTIVVVAFAENAVPQQHAVANTWQPLTESLSQADMYAEINQCRKSMGKAALTRSLALEQAANDRVHTYSHFANGMDARQQAKHNGWQGSGWGENIAAGYAAAAAVDAWFNEKPPLDGHRRNILGDYNVVGAAYNGTNSVAIFGKE